MINGMILILRLLISHSLMAIIPRSPSYRVYISQLIRLARASSFVSDCNSRKKFLSTKLVFGRSLAGPAVV